MVKPEDKKNVVIVGGGAAGSVLARDLSKKLDSSKFNLILVTDRQYFVHLIAMARAVVTPEDHLEDTAIFGYDNLFPDKKGQVKYGKAVSVIPSSSGQPGEVVLDSGEKVPYHSLVLATGSKWPKAIDLTPGPLSEGKAHIKQWRESFQNAKHVVIVGGGAVGIELAGEIRYHLPDKKVTIVHRTPLLLNDVYPDKFRKDLERRLRVRKIDLVLGDSLDGLSDKVNGVTTKNGQSIPDADLVVQAFGSTPNTQFLASLTPSVLSEHGHVKVDEFLQVRGLSGVFAVGDIIDWPEQKQAAKGNTHVTVVAANLLNFLSGKAPSKKYGGSAEMILIPLGKSGGAGYLSIMGGIQMGDFLARTLKGKDLFVSMTRKKLGQK